MTGCMWVSKVKIILSQRVYWMECPSSEKETPQKLNTVFLDILLFDELEGTCLVCK